MASSSLRSRETRETKSARIYDDYELPPLDILTDVEGIGIVRLQQSDVIRHPVVKRVIEAFEKQEQKDKALKEQKDKE